MKQDIAKAAPQNASFCGAVTTKPAVLSCGRTAKINISGCGWKSKTKFLNTIIKFRNLRLD
jgi:hypothetical protein